MAIDIRQGVEPHIFWMDIESNGVLVEVAVMKRDGNGNIYYIPLENMDDVDRTRLLRIIKNRNATNFELWDLMDSITLNNGVNALTYFHQMVIVMTPSGVKQAPTVGRLGAAQATGRIRTRPETPEEIAANEAAANARLVADRAAAEQRVANTSK